MPDILEQLYCSQQIHIPPTFPSILKLYAKAAIRTQPYDLLKWSAAYFRALAEGEEPPVKQRIEYPPVTTPSGLSPGFLKVLIKQIGNTGTVEYKLLLKKWEGICLKANALQDMLRIGEFDQEIDWLHFIGIAAGHLTKSLTQTMYLVCELLTEEPEGGSDMIPLETFREVYTYLARLNCGTPEDGIPDDDDDEEEEIADVQSKPVEIVHEEQCTEGTEQETEQSQDDSEDPCGAPPEIEGEGEGEEKADDKKDEAVQITASELDALKPKKPPPRLTPEEAIHVPGIGPILSKKHIQAVLDYLEYWAERQAGMVMPRNIHHFLCPPLDRVVVPDKEQQ